MSEASKIVKDLENVIEASFGHVTPGTSLHGDILQLKNDLRAVIGLKPHAEPAIAAGGEPGTVNGGAAAPIVAEPVDADGKITDLDSGKVEVLPAAGKQEDVTNLASSSRAKPLTLGANLASSKDETKTD